MKSLIQKYKDWDYTLNPIIFLQNLILEYKEWKFEKWWRKEYNEEIPDWLLEPRTNFIETFSDPRFIKWLEKLPQNKKQNWIKKIELIFGAYERLGNAIDDELIRRGEKCIPETTRS